MRDRQIMYCGNTSLFLMASIAVFFWRTCTVSATLVPPRACAQFLANCTNIPHNEYVSIIETNNGGTVFGSYSIGVCEEEADQCLCYNQTFHKTKGIIWRRKKPEEGVWVGYEVHDEDCHDCSGQNDCGCHRNTDVSDGEGISDGSTYISLDTAGTHQITSPIINSTKDNGLCKPTGTYCSGPGWIDGQTVIGYVHVYDVTLEVATSAVVPTTITWGITEFTGNLSGQPCDSVEPLRLKIRVEGPDGALWGGTLHDGWTGSEVWDGHWTSPSGQQWDGCTPVEIILYTVPLAESDLWGLREIITNDFVCEDCTYSPQTIEERLVFPDTRDCKCGTEAESIPSCGFTSEKKCLTDSINPVYNCYAWTVNRTDVWVVPTRDIYPPQQKYLVVDYQYGNKDHIITQNEWDAFYAAHGLIPTNNCSEACVGWNSVHAYNMCSCEPAWESKCGDGERGSHGRKWLPQYGAPTRFYKRQ